MMGIFLFIAGGMLGFALAAMFAVNKIAEGEAAMAELSQIKHRISERVARGNRTRAQKRRLAAIAKMKDAA